MKKIVTIFAFLIFLLGGCNGMNNSNSNLNSKNNSENQLPGTLAFQDEFTREFMASTEEIEDGYYLFESRTGGYTILFPNNAKIDQTFYGYGEKEERVEITVTNEEENENSFVYWKYFDEESTNWIDSYLKLLSNTTGYEGEYEEYDVNDNRIYYGEMNKSVSDKGNGTYFTFISYIKSKDTDKGIIFDYTVGCIDESKACEMDLDEKREKAKKLIESVKFSNE